MNGRLSYRRERGLVSVVAGLLIVASARVAAHDFWIEPSAYRPKLGALVGLRLLVGQDMLGDPVPREPSSVKQFVVFGSSGQKSVPGRDGGNPAGIFRVDEPGLLVVGYQSLPRPIELAPDKFAQYLGEEGLDEIRSVSARFGIGDRPAHELFSRCAKSLLLGDALSSKTDHDRALGLTFEIVAERNPYLTAVGQPLPFVLTYEGKPQKGALVIAINQRDPSKKLTARSDRQGRVTFRFPVAGGWLVKSVHMIPAPPATHADWESFWASVTFELPEIR